MIDDPTTRLLRAHLDALTTQNAGLWAALAAPEPLRPALARLRAAWDALGRCVDEFEPEDMTACSERRDELDSAILAVLAAAKGDTP